VSDPRPALAAGRTAHLAVMLDTCTITRAAGAEVYNPVTKTYTKPVTTVYTGPCRVRPWRGNDEQAAGTEISVYRYQLRFPLTPTAPEIRRYDTVTITASSHPAMAGKVLTVSDPEVGTTATALTVVAELAS
jgi:hypothetical protein